MQPFRLGKYIVGNTFQLDTETGYVTRIQVHKVAEWQQRSERKEIIIDMRTPKRELTEDERLATYLDGIEKAFEKVYRHLPLNKPVANVYEDDYVPPKAPRTWTEHDEETYQATHMWECAVEHWANGEY